MPKSLELDPKIENADIRKKETEFKIKSLVTISIQMTTERTKKSMKIWIII